MRTPTCLLASLLLSAASAPASTFSVTNAGATFTITRSGDTSASETVRYRTVPLTAYPGQHYTAKSDTLVFAPGQTSTNIAVSEPSSTTIEAYRYQTGGRRSYRFDVTDEKGFPLASCDRSRQCGSIFSYGKLNTSVSSLVTLTSAGAFSSGMSSSKYVDVSFNPPSGYVQGSGKTLEGYVLIDDSYDYAQKPATVSTATLVDATGATGSYLASMGCKIHAAVCFAEKEKDDGYQYLQIVAGDSTASYDTGADPNGGVKDPTNSVYKVCFEFADGSNAEGNIYFPHRGTTSSEFSNSAGKLHQHKYKSGYGGSGAVVLPATTASITTRFDAGGDNDDTWGYKDLFVRMALCDATAPALYGGSSAGVVVAPGTYAVGSTVYVSVPFNEIVRVAGTPTLSTTWGTLSYVAGDGSNVLTFQGRIEAKTGVTLKVNSLSGTVKDLAGNSLAVPLSINTTYPSCVSQIPWSGSGTPDAPYLILTTGQLDALAILVDKGEQYSSSTHFSLGADLAYPHTTAWNDETSTENNFTPVGGYGKSFGGDFHGNGHVVSGIRIYRSGDTLDKGDSSLALFGYAYGGSVRDVVVADANVSGYAYCGGVVGYNGAAVTNCLAFNVRVAGRESSSAGAVAGHHDANPSASGLLSNHYRDCIVNGASLGVGTGSRGDLPGARSLHALDLDPDVAAAGAETVVITNATFYAADSAVSLSYGGTPPFGYVLAGYATNSVALPDDVSAFAMPAADISVAPRFKRDTYTIEWRNDADAGSALLATTTVLYEDTPAYPDDAPVPAKPSTAQFDYAFAGAWSPAPAPATSNATYTALYTSLLRSYDVVWLDGDGAPLLTNRLDYGSTPAYPAGAPVPTKSSTPQYTYAFAGSWSPAIVPVSGPAAYTAVFDAIPVTNGCCGLLPENGGSNLLWRVEDTDRNGTFDTLFVCTNPAAASDADFSMRDYGNSAEDIPWLHSAGTLERVVLSDGVASVGASAFSGFINVRTVSFPESLVNIGSEAFSSCVALSTLSLPESIRTLGFQAFADCRGLRRIDIPTGIEDVGLAAFAWIGSANDPAHVWYRGTTAMWEAAGGSLAITTAPPLPTYAVLHLAAPVSVDPAISGGTVAADLAYAFEGETVTLSVVPADGFVVGAVGYATGSVLHAVAPAAGGVYAFAMPPAAATATATFRALVQFLGADGATVLQSGLWDCGSTPAYTSAPPTKASDAAYAYFFSGWEPAVAPVSGPASYTATFAPTSHWALLSDDLAAGGTVVLSRDVAATAADAALTVPSGVAVTLDLAGHTIDRALAQPAPSGEAIRIEGSFALTNSVPASGAITGGNTAIDFEDFTSFGSGGGVYVAYGGAFTMNGGAISGNAAEYFGGGASVENGGAFTMNGGALSGNTAKSKGGGVLVSYGGDFAMSGGEISGNAAGQDGGGVYLRSSSDPARLRISGAPRVLGNVVTNFSDVAAPAAASDIRFNRDSSRLWVVGDLAPGARLGIVPDVRRAVTTNLLDHAAGTDGGLSLFFSDDPEYTLALDADGEVCVVPPTYALSYVPRDHVAVTVWSVASDPKTATDVASLGLAPASFDAAFSPDEPFAIRLDFDPGWFLDIENPFRIAVAGSDEILHDIFVLLDGAALYLVADGPNAPATLDLVLAPFSRNVAFRDYDGTELQSGPVGYGVLPACTNATPSRTAPDPDHYYAFAGWSPALAPVVPDLAAADPAAPLVYTATYELREIPKFAVAVDPAVAHGEVEVWEVDGENWAGYSGPVQAGTGMGLKFAPDPGYGLVSRSVVDTNGVPVALDGANRFTMPASDVTVSAVFAEALPISVRVDESAQDTVTLRSVLANGVEMDPAAAVPGAAVDMVVYSGSFLRATTAAVTTTNGAAVASEVACLDEAYGAWAVCFTMPAEPVVVSLSAVPATFDRLVLLPGTNTVDAASRVFSFVPQETGVYRFAMEDGRLRVFDCHGEELFDGSDEASCTLLAGETCYVRARANGWDGTPRPLVAERTDETFTLHSVAVDPDIEHGTVVVSPASAPEGHRVYATPVPATGYAYAEDSLRYICGGLTNWLGYAPDGTPCFRMPADDVLVTAEFEPIPFAVTVDPDIAHGTVRVYVVTSGGGAGIFDHTEPYSGPVAVGTRISLKTSPDAGYGFVSRSIVDTNGVSIALDENGCFTMPASDVTVSATFAEALPISVRVDESAPDAISDWSVFANGLEMYPDAAAPGAAVEMVVYPSSFLLAPTAIVTTTNGVAVASEVVCLDESYGDWAVCFTMPAEPVVVSLSAVPATFDPLVLLPGTNIVDARSRVFSFVPGEAGVYRFAMDGGILGVHDCRGKGIFSEFGETSGTLLAGETYYVLAFAIGWDGTPQSLVAERTDGTVTLHSVAVDPDIAHGTVATSLASAPEGHWVYATPVPAPGWAYVEDSLRYVCGGETNELDSAYDGTPCFQMPDDDVLVTAEFEPIPFAVTVDPDIAHGTVVVREVMYVSWGASGSSPYSGPVPAGTLIELRFTPALGYGFVSWSVVDTNGVPVAVDGNNRFSMPASDVTVSAVFARAKSISVEEDEAAKKWIDYWECYAGGAYTDPAAAAPGATVELWIEMESFVFAPTATVATAGGAAIAATVERVNVLDYDGWSVRFTMPAEPVVVSLSAVPADYPALHEGVNVVDPPYHMRFFAFTPETTGYSSFVAAGSYYFGVVDSFGAGMGLTGGMCSAPLLAGERYYVLYGERDGEEEHTIVVSMVGDPVATYAVAVDPSIAGGTVTPSVLRAAEGCLVYLAVAEEADAFLGTLRATWTNGTETVELEIGEGAFGDAYFTMPAGDVSVTAEFPRARLLSVVTDAKIELDCIYANERDYYGTTSVKVAPNTEVVVDFWCPTGYEPLVAVATAAGETVPSELDRDNCLSFTMPDAPVVVTVSAVRADLPALVVGDNAADAQLKVFSFAPSETAEYRFASENGYMQVFDDQGEYLEGKFNSLSLVLVGGETYFVAYGYQKTWDGTPQNLLVEKLETIVQLYRVSVDPDIVGGTVETSLTNAPRGHRVYLRPVPAPGYAYVEGTVTVDDGTESWKPDDRGDGTFVFTLYADATVTAFFEPLPFSFPPYLAGADDAVLTNYVRWAAAHGPDLAGTQEAAFLLNVAPSATPTELRIDGIEVGAEGATIRASATAGGAAVDLTKINGILAVEAGDTVTNLVPKAVRGATFSANGTTATIPVPSSDGFFLRARIGTSAP